MTQRLDEAISRLRQLPPPEQDEAAETILAMINEPEPSYQLTPEQVEEVCRTLDGLENGTGQLATGAEVEAMWKRLGA